MELEYFYIIAPQRCDFVKLGRWRGSVDKLHSRYRTVYGIFQSHIFQCYNSAKVEMEAFSELSRFRWRNELFEKDVVSFALKFAEKNCLDNVQAVDLLEKLEKARIRKETQARLTEIRTSLSPKKDTSSEIEKMMRNIIIKEVLRNTENDIDKIEKKRAEAENERTIAEVSKKRIREWLPNKSISGDDTDTVSMNELFTMYKRETGICIDRKLFGIACFEVFGSETFHERVKIGSKCYRNIWRGKRLKNL